MEKKNTLLLTVIAVATLLVAVVGATFAYFTAAGGGTATSQVNVTTRSVDSTTTTAENILLDITLDDMLQTNGMDDLTAFDSATGSVTISNTVGTGGGTRVCTYDLIYTPVTAYTTSVANTGDLMEFSIEGTAAADNGSGATSINSFGPISLNDVNSATILADDATFTVTGTEDTETTSVLTWTLTAKFYNLAVDQTDNAGKAFGGNITTTAPTCVNS